jgi:hypothetical protein
MPAEVDYSGLWAIAGLNRPELRDPPWQPVVPLALADEDESIFTTIRQGDLLDPGSGNGIAQNEEMCYSPQTSQDEGRQGGLPWQAQRQRW